MTAWPRAIHAPGSAIRRVRFAPDDPGIVVLTLAPAGPDTGDRVAVWHESAGSLVRLRLPNGNVRDALAMPRGRHPVVAVNGTLAELNPISGVPKPLARLDADSAYELATDRAGEIIAMSVSGEARPLIVVDGSRARTFGPPPDRSFSPMFPNAAVSADGTCALLSCGFDDLYLARLPEGQVEPLPRIGTVAPHRSIADPTTLQAALGLVGKYTRRTWLSEHGDRLIAAGMIPYRSYAPAMCLRILDRVAGDQFQDWYVAMDTTFTAVDLSPDQQLCVTSDGQTRDVLAVRDVRTGQLLTRIEHPGANIVEARFSWDGSRLALAGGDVAFVHSVQVRHWIQPRTDNALWHLTIDDRTLLTPVGDPEFVRGYRDRAGSLEHDWGASVALAEKVCAR